MAGDQNFLLLGNALADAVLAQLADEQVQIALVDCFVIDAAVGEQLPLPEAEHVDGPLAQQGLGAGHIGHVCALEGLPHVGVVQKPQLAEGLGLGLEDNLEELARHGLDLAPVAVDDDFEQPSEVRPHLLGRRRQELVLL